MADNYLKLALVEEMKKLASVFYQEDQLRRQILELQRQGFKQMLKLHSLVEVSDDIPANAKAAQLVKHFQKQGLTSAVRSLLAGTGEWMSATQVRDLLVRLRIDLTRYKTPLGSITTILNRLEEAGYATTMIDKKTNKTLFHWKEPEFWTKEEIEEYPEHMIAPQPRKRRRKTVKTTKPQLQLTEGSLKD